jgi:general secretion pathway protein A
MFLNFFGLREQPFGITPDPRFLYLSAAHRQSLDCLCSAIEANRDFLALIAKAGMGKTTMLFHLLEKFRPSAQTVFIFQTHCNPREFLCLLLAQLGYEGDHQDFALLQQEFRRRLLAESRAGTRMIILIDEAQNLSPEVLEMLPALGEVEPGSSNLMHVILAGQPQLADRLASPALVQLRQRLSTVADLAPLSLEDIRNYIKHRLSLAGYRGEPLFTPEAYEAIASFSQGIPRNVNNFCFSGLTLSYALERKVVDIDVVRRVTANLDIPQTSSSVPLEPTRSKPPSPVAVPVSPPRPSKSTRPDLSPAEAAAYMQNVALQLRNWRNLKANKTHRRSTIRECADAESPLKSA